MSRASEPLEPVRETYFRVSPKIWGEPWSADARVLALYLLTCPHRSTEGLYRLSLGYAADDLGWNPERLREPLAELLAQGFAEYDPKARVVFVAKALKYQAPANPNGYKAAARRLVELPDTPLFAAFLEAARAYCPRFAEALPVLLPERFAQPFAQSPALSSCSYTPTPEELSTDPDPVDNSGAAPAPADQELGGSSDPDQEPVILGLDPALPPFPVTLCGAIKRAGGSAALDAVLADGSDLNLTARRHVQAVSELVDALLGHLPAAKLESARETALRGAFADAERAKPDNLAAYLTASRKRATHLGDLIGDELVSELLAIGKTRKGRK